MFGTEICSVREKPTERRTERRRDRAGPPYRICDEVKVPVSEVPVSEVPSREESSRCEWSELERRQVQLSPHLGVGVDEDLVSVVQLEAIDVVSGDAAADGGAGLVAVGGDPKPLQRPRRHQTRYTRANHRHARRREYHVERRTTPTRFGEEEAFSTVKQNLAITVLYLVHRNLLLARHGIPRRPPPRAVAGCGGAFIMR